MGGVPHRIAQDDRIEVDEDHPVARQEDVIGLQVSVDRRGRHLLQTGRDRGGDRPNSSAKPGLRPLDDAGRPPQLLELDLQGAARHTRAPEVLLVERRHGLSRGAQRSSRLTLPQHVL